MKPINIDENCQFLKDLNTPNNFMGTNKALYNLAVCRGQVGLFCKGIKPTKNWRLMDIRIYFGLFDTKGKKNVLNVLNLLSKTLKK